MNAFAIVVVLYFPDSESRKNVYQLAGKNHLVIAVDNTTPPALSETDGMPNVKIVANKKNIGLAAALNKGIALAGKLGYKDIFLLDQDSRLPTGYFREMLRFKRKTVEKNSNYAMHVPNFFDRNSGTYARFPALKKYRFGHIQCGEPRAALNKHALIAITSGSLIDYSKHLEIGPMQEDYFIDFLDNEYCLRLASKGFSVAINCRATINHSIGKRGFKRLLGLTFKPNHHPPSRRYYISRNGIATAKKYFKPYKSYAFLIGLRLMHEYLSIIFYEQHKMSKLWASCQGVIDGLARKMGPKGA